MKIGQKILANGISGKVLWIDSPWKNQDGTDADVLVKVKLEDSADPEFLRLSEIVEDEKITVEEMELSNIKKALYKENPQASFKHIKKGTAHYSAHVVSLETIVNFEIPVNDMGDSEFKSFMDSKYLIRWIANPSSELV